MFLLTLEFFQPKGRGGKGIAAARGGFLYQLHDQQGWEGEVYIKESLDGEAYRPCGLLEFGARAVKEEASWMRLNAYLVHPPGPQCGEPHACRKLKSRPWGMLLLPSSLEPLIMEIGYSPYYYCLLIALVSYCMVMNSTMCGVRYLLLFVLILPPSSFSRWSLERERNAALSIFFTAHNSIGLLSKQKRPKHCKLPLFWQ